MRGDLKPIIRQDEAGPVHNVIMMPLKVDHFNVVGAWIQGFRVIEGRIDFHTEPEGITEIYFPLFGRFTASRGGEWNRETLTGIVGKQTEDKTLSKLMTELPKKLSQAFTYTVEYDSSTQKATLVIQDGDNRVATIDGFVIPPDTKHSTASYINNLGRPESSRYLAVKIKTPTVSA